LNFSNNPIRFYLPGLVSVGIIWLGVLIYGCENNKSYPVLNQMISTDSVPLLSDNEVDSILKSNIAIHLYDTRTRQEFDVSHIPGAIWIGENDTLSYNAEGTLPVVVYCSIGYRSGKAGERLLQAGYPRVYNLNGGIFHWVNSGRKVVNNKGVTTDSIHGYSPLWGRWINKGTVVYGE
jgi:rhodanese-related sulfurtransferase